MILLDSTMSGNLARDLNGRKNFQSLASGSHHCQSQRLIALLLPLLLQPLLLLLRCEGAAAAVVLASSVAAVLNIPNRQTW